MGTEKASALGQRWRGQQVLGADREAPLHQIRGPVGPCRRESRALTGNGRTFTAEITRRGSSLERILENVVQGWREASEGQRLARRELCPSAQVPSMCELAPGEAGKALTRRGLLGCWQACAPVPSHTDRLCGRGELRNLSGPWLPYL